MRKMKQKKITEFEIVNKVMRLDAEVYRILENAPRKFEFNKKQQVKDALGDAEQLLIDAIDTPPDSTEGKQEKVWCLNRSRSRIRFCEVQLYRMNDDAAISNRAMADLMIMLYDLYADYEKLLSSMRKKYFGPDRQGCAPAAVPGVIGTTDCGRGGGPHA